MKILLVGNLGSLLKETAQFLEGSDHTVTILDAADGLASIGEASKLGPKYPVVIYVGGEVRDESVMHFKNCIFPAQLLDYVDKNEGRFIYLSTLAVYPQHSTPATVLPRLEQYEPRGAYGLTKAEFDRTVFASDYHFVAIQPASIVGPRLMTSSLDKVLDVLLRFPIMRFVEINTLIGFCERSTVIKMIGATVADSEIRGLQIVCSDLSISDIQIEVYGEGFRPVICLDPILRLMVRVIRTFSPGLGSRLSAVINMTRFEASKYLNVSDAEVTNLIQRRIRLIMDHGNG
ncbi:NAD-dependent epimerase/dehydratase family protein [Pseudomonadales bacterium]|nr:NAD-dependent epimerase/dehydratase family protein [Pseudomonadales bacterium]